MEVLQNIINDELETAKTEIIQRTIDAGAVASGKTNEGFSVVASESSGQLIGYSYVGVLERGRSAGKTPYNFHLIIAKWAEAKGITFSDEKERDRWTKAVAWSIRLRGTVLHKEGYEVDIFSNPIEALIANISNRITPIYSSEITNNIFKWQQ